MNQFMKTKLGKKDAIYLSVIAVLVIAVIVVGLALGIEPKEEEENFFKVYYDNKCESYGIQNYNLSKGQIIFIGDSITDLCPLDDYYLDLPLACYNRGIGGDTTEGVLDRLQVSIFDLMPSKVVLMIGTNDVNGGKSEEYIVNNYAKIVKEIKKGVPNVELYCMSIIPQNKDMESYSDVDTTANNIKIQSINGKIKGLSEEQGATYIDLYPALLGKEGNLDKAYSDDGLHLNAEGFVVWSGILKPYLS